MRLSLKNSFFPWACLFFLCLGFSATTQADTKKKKKTSKQGSDWIPPALQKSWKRTRTKWQQTIDVYKSLRKLLGEDPKDRKKRIAREKKEELIETWEKEDKRIEKKLKEEFQLEFQKRACFRGSESSCDKLLKTFPHSLSVKLLQKNILLRRKKWKKLYPLCIELANRKSASLEDRLCLARTYQGLKKRTQAQKIYRKILEDYPTHGPTWLELGKLELKRKSYKLAEMSCLKASILLARETQPWTCLGHVFLSQQDRKKARKYFGKACRMGELTSCRVLLSIRPKGMQGLLVLGMAWTKMGTKGISQEAIHRSCQVGIISACETLASNLLKNAKKAIKSKQPEKALSLFQKASRLAPKYAPTWRIKGLFLFKQKRWSEACYALKTALKLKAAQPALWQTLGQCYIKLAEQTKNKGHHLLKKACKQGATHACSQKKGKK